jgi:hypothetical protein
MVQVSQIDIKWRSEKERGIKEKWRRGKKGLNQKSKRIYSWLNIKY